MSYCVRPQTAVAPWRLAINALALLAALTGWRLWADETIHAVRAGADCPDLEVWGIYPPEKILKTEPLPTSAPTGPISVALAQDEYEPLLIVVRPKGGRPVLDLRLEGQDKDRVAGSPGDPGVSFTCHRVGYVHVFEPSGMSVLPEVGDRYLHTAVPFGGTGRAGFFPDRLIPETKSEAQPGENTQFWVTLRTQPHTAAGTHAGLLRLRYRGGEVRVPLAVVVHDFALPPRPSLRNTTCWSPQYLRGAWNDGQLRALYADVAAHRQSLDPVLPFPKVTPGADGALTVDASAWSQMATYCLSEVHPPMTQLFAPRTGAADCNVYFLWPATVVRQQKWLGIPIFAEDLTLTDAFRKSYGAYLGDIARVVNAAPWGPRGEHSGQDPAPHAGPLCIATMDEPHTAEDFRAIREYAAFVREVAPGLQRFCTAPPRDELLGSVDVWCPQVFDAATVATRQAMGEEFMFYKNWLHLIDMPMANPRLLGWIAWRMDATGWLTYATMGRWERAWDEPYAIYPNTGIRAWGLGLWWYPDPLGPGILPSIRWETMRDGCEDYEYMKLLQDLAQDPQETADAAATARAAKAFLAEAPARVIRYPGLLPGSTGGDGWENRPAYTQAMADVCEQRDQAAALIGALMAHRRSRAR